MMPAVPPRNMSDYEAARRSFQWQRPEHFNFAMDVIDRHAAERPNALALLWSDESGQERRFTFAELKQQSLHAAQFLLSLGMRRGDRAFVLMPGTPMLTPKDIRYRLSALPAPSSPT